MDAHPRRKPEEPKADPLVSKHYIQAIRQFLATFKTQPCILEHEHDTRTCPSHHGPDLRRNPYDDHTFAYYPTPQLLHQSRQSSLSLTGTALHHDKQLCQSMLCLNDFELMYHPILYKVQRCGNFYNCGLHYLCPNLHQEDQKYFDYGEFFRFDINTHKTKLCQRRDFHERKTCVYYHNESDRRRPSFETYSHELCTRGKCSDQLCPYSHNKIQQVYHPSRYKSKFCKSYTSKNTKCEYKQFCAFAHTQAEIKIEMIHLLNRDHDFYLQKYKTVWCPDTMSHDRSGCVYAHNIQDFRRNPFKYNYDSEKCPFWNFDDELKSLQDSGCKAGMSCNKCHGWMEQRFHPHVYKKTALILEKKISNPSKQIKQQPGSNKEKSRISMVVQEKVQEITKAVTQQTNGIRDVGAPFFNKKQAVSESSRKTVALTTNIESDESVRQQVHSNKKVVTNQSTNCEVSSTNRKKSMYLYNEEDIWKNSPNENSEVVKKEEERARSENKFDDCETVYSHSLKQAVADHSILRKLKNNNIHELRLKNLSETEIQEFKFLDRQEKDQLHRKIKLYQLRKEMNPIIYNVKLTKLFIRKQKQQILQKAKEKKIKQEKLLSMKSKEISKLDFLTEAEKKQLETLIAEYKKLSNQEQFSQINEEITRFVSPKRTPQNT